MEIRPVLSTDDWLKISHVYEESWKSTYKNIIPQDYLDRIPEGQWANQLNSYYSLIMLKEGCIIGTSSYAKARFQDMDGYGEIISIYLLPKYWGKGYGKKLLFRVVQNLQKLEYNKIYLWVLEENYRARHFYEQFGFEQSKAILYDKIGGIDLKEVQYIYQTK